MPTKPVIGTETTANEALQRLREGNARFVAGESEHDHADQARRTETARLGQHPIACVLACADSRVPVEIVFDCGIGDLFVVRVAGNVAGPHKTAGSVEYAVTQLGVPLVIVLGHSGCGAVEAAMDKQELGPPIQSLLQAIKPACAEARQLHPDADHDALLDAAVEANVRHQLQALRELAPGMLAGESAGDKQATGAIYDLASGAVRFL